MTHDSAWQRHDIETRIQELLDAARVRGTQRIVDGEGRFDVTYVPEKMSLEELFSKPGPLADDDEFDR